MLIPTKSQLKYILDDDLQQTHEDLMIAVYKPTNLIGGNSILSDLLLNIRGEIERRRVCLEGAGLKIL